MLFNHALNTVTMEFIPRYDWLPSMGFIHGCNTISYIMEGYQQINIHSISCILCFFKEPKYLTCYFICLFQLYMLWWMNYACYFWLHKHGRCDFLNIILSLVGC